MATTPRAYEWEGYDLIAENVTETGAMFHFFDTNAQVIYPDGTLKYKWGRVPQGHWKDLDLSEEIELEAFDYKMIKSDHPSTGSLYIIGLARGNSNDVIYLFRYDYERDVSELVQDATFTLQADNPITEIRANIKNVKDSMFNEETSLFTPSARMTLGVAFGMAAPVQLAIGYVDEVGWKHGSKAVSISGRNSVGFYLNDQTFDETISFNAAATTVIPQIFERFGIVNYVIDPLGTGNVKIDVAPADTGMKVMQEISNLLTDVTEPGKNWEVEELYDGTVVVGYDAFRAGYAPKGVYVFNGANDVFTKAINRSIDGSYTQVRCTGTDANKQELTAVVMPVTPIKYWEPGAHKTYHAPKVEGVTQAKLAKYCEVLAQQLKEAGRLVTYRTTLRPQLYVGDVAETPNADPEEPNNRLGIITEIRHTFGDRGYATEFTATSGGEITTMDTRTYTSVKSSNGNNRQTRINDLVSKNAQSEAIQAQESSETSSYRTYDFAHFDGTGHIELPLTLLETHQIRVTYKVDTGIEGATVVFGNSLNNGYAHLKCAPLVRKNYTSDGSNVVDWDAVNDRYLKHTFICNKSGNNYYDELSGGQRIAVTQFTGVDTNAKIWIAGCATLSDKFEGNIYEFAVVDLTTDETLIALTPRELYVNGALVGGGLYDIKSGRFYTCSGMTLGNE